MINYFEKQFELRYFEMNKFGEASSTAILTLLEETAADHCYAINHSLFDLEKQNIGWVLLSGIMEMDYYPAYKEKIVIRTWLSKYSTIKGFRENIIYNEQGRIIGRAKGLWVFFDIDRRRPIQIPDAIKDKWLYFNEESINHDITKKIDIIDSSDHIKEFKINRFDVDTNLHVNNIRYLQWLIESIPEDIIDNFYLHSIDGRFIAEAQLGDTIMSFTERDDNLNSFIHNIKTQENNTVCASARTVWKSR
ncbi:acyl-ACP thioesterase [Aquipluma nitroreducens]|uniref:Acyl-ACP thioesterase n=1 Tax=Aquipluma nitroreducens TaxID=2010828 RepID=A0A5K7S851_9BACT|nr:acyl-ACP thioesterase domain-containing protein [Aquipluma nitroreducens]BBE17665.1 acyl-ACP thioesterase [Aquipluma nitroreducens]